MQLSQRCFAVTGLAYSSPWSVNAGFISGDHSTLLIDGGANALSAATVAGYAAVVRPANRLLAINTERHFDHVGGNSHYRELGAELYGHASGARTEAEFQAEVAEYGVSITDPARRGEHAIFYLNTRLCNPNLTLDSGATFDLGNCSAVVLPTPGHTSSNLSVFEPEERILYCGDLLVNGYAPNLQCGGPDEWRQWIASIEQVERLAPRAVIPGHGAVARDTEVRRLMNNVRSYLEDSIRSKRQSR